MKSSGFVVNASPLITLGRLSRLELFPQLAEAVLVPRGVLDEIAAKDDQHLAESIASQPGFTVMPDEPLPATLVEWDLGRGECCVIAHAVKRAELIAVLDDRRARQAAHAFGLRVTGTLGILVRAARRFDRGGRAGDRRHAQHRFLRERGRGARSAGQRGRTSREWR